MKKEILCLLCCIPFWMTAHAQKNTFAFRDTTLTDQQRVENLLSILTLDEKLSLLSANLEVPRLGIPDCGHFEGLHGLTLGGPGAWGGREKDKNGRMVPTNSPTTIFPNPTVWAVLGTKTCWKR